MKLINKILCFLSVLVILVPLFCFNVSADDSSLTVEEYYITGGTGNFDGVTIKDYDSNISNVSYPHYAFRIGSSSDKKFVYYDMSDSISRLKLGLSHIYRKSSSVQKDFYYFYRYGIDSTRGFDVIDVYFSFSPLTIVSNRLSSDTSFYHICYLINSSGYTVNYLYNKSSWFGFSDFSDPIDSSSYHNLVFDSSSSDFYNSSSYYQNDRQNPINWDEIYSNCDLEINGINLKNEPFKDFKDQISVSLTPEFGLDMDRIDPLTNQSDYFKLEITNNSDSAIQWLAGIYDPQLITSDTVFIDSLSLWNYVCRDTYYDSHIDEEKGIFRNTYTYSGTLKTGSTDYHYLSPGETFSDIIYWENIKIKPNVIYHFFVNAVKTDLNHATLNINPVHVDDSSDLHSVTIVEQSYKDTCLYTDSEFGFHQLESNIFNVEFSCLSMPAFTTTIRGGNSIFNSSGNDRYNLLKNYEIVSDINGVDTKINKDYVDPSILANTFNRSDVSVDIDSFSVDDVKSYITSCQSFFTLIKEALLSFPAFIWALICFGLTGLIVIGIVKAVL